jgi:hypothetical protein
LIVTFGGYASSAASQSRTSHGKKTEKKQKETARFPGQASLVKESNAG